MSIPIPQDGLMGLAAVEPVEPLGTMPNAQHQHEAGFLEGAPYRLAVVEFDDQGRCYDRAQMEGVASALDTLASGTDAIVVVFVHGWKHDARTDDDNLSAFRVLLAMIVAREAANEAESGAAPRQVLGVFVGWPGLSRYGLGDTVADTTFWDREAAGHRVATGSVRELFGRLRTYRRRRLELKGSPLLVIAGHSFGGMIVYSALAQSLIEAASAPPGPVGSSFADLVLLINPAIEGSRYLPVADLVSTVGAGGGAIPQLPLFVCAQADNDQAVGTWFPIGRAADGHTQAAIGPLEQRCVTHALGFIDEFVTHRLSGPAGGSPFVLDPPQIARPNPFWVVRASKEVIDGHGGIWKGPFLQFLASILFKRVEVSHGPAAAAPKAPIVPHAPLAAGRALSVAPGVPWADRHLAAFAQTLGAFVDLQTD